jgi:hypothetical protein
VRYFPPTQAGHLTHQVETPWGVFVADTRVLITVISDDNVRIDFTPPSLDRAGGMVMALPRDSVRVEVQAPRRGVAPVPAVALADLYLSADSAAQDRAERVIGTDRIRGALSYRRKVLARAGLT